MRTYCQSVLNWILKFFIKNDQVHYKGNELESNALALHSSWWVPVCFLHLVGKWYPLKAVHPLEEREEEGGKKGKKEENYSLQMKPTWEHKTLFRIDSILCTMCNIYLMWSLWKVNISTRRATLEKQLNLERSVLVFDHQPHMFCSGRAHQWLRSNLTEDNISAHNH